MMAEFDPAADRSDARGQASAAILVTAAPDGAIDAGLRRRQRYHECTVRRTGSVP
jgi:hypothetical protein